MTPEQLKSTCIMFRTELEVQGASMGIMSVFDSMCSYLGGESRDLNRALAALEEAQGDIITLKQKVELYEEALETYKDNRAAMKAQLAEAQQTIARQREVWQELKSVVSTNATGGRGEDINDYDIMLNIIGGLEGEKTDEGHDNA